MNPVLQGLIAWLIIGVFVIGILLVELRRAYQFSHHADQAIRLTGGRV